MALEWLKTIFGGKQDSAKDSNDKKYIGGPDVTSAGFIPYYKTIEHVPPNNYTRHQFASPPFDLLFDSGNTPAPKPRFAGMDDFLRFVASKNFRGVMTLRDVKLYCDENGKPRELKVKHYEEIGYTPMRDLIAWRLFGSPKFKIFYDKGIGEYGCKATFASDSAQITQWVRFRIGKLGNFGAWIMTGLWAPYVWMKTVYTIFCDGRVRVSFHGSKIPTQYYYVNWVVNGGRDMLGNTTAEIDGFLHAGDGNDGPGGENYFWP